MGFNLQISLWLWFTVLFANFAEAMAEGRGQGPGQRAAQDPHTDHMRNRLRARRIGATRSSPSGSDEERGRRGGLRRRDHTRRRRDH
ncbi:MAG: hypothetical protein MZV70_57365 [Desulfobacterales bacterium]|nr:hypothetical protein [Desulfobacterales bacterium]